MSEELKPIPVTGTSRLDLAKIAAESPDSKPISLADYVAKHRLLSCVDCYRGGHTRTVLFKVIKSIASGEVGYACQDHVGKYIRPKDLKIKRRP